uniref:Uncharacterized protein n=1 Tax=Cacopsylla melanoneura TaxID=428564 RepID=A0A8D8UA78_9HEMI
MIQCRQDKRFLNQAHTVQLGQNYHVPARSSWMGHSRGLPMRHPPHNNIDGGAHHTTAVDKWTGKVGTIPALSMKPARTLPFSMDDILGAPTYITVIATTITSVIMTIMVAICCLRKCGINLSRPREDVKHAMRA